jgi:hypothetical protein
MGLEKVNEWVSEAGPDGKKNMEVAIVKEAIRTVLRV